MRILITGITGFAGSWLAEALLQSEQCQLFGVSRSAEWPTSWPALPDHVNLRSCDLCDGESTEALLREIEPEQIYHVAGFASTGRSFSVPDDAWHGNLTATRSLLDAITRWGGKPRILSVSSGMVYGHSTRTDRIVEEDSPFFPVSPYATSKAAADLVSYQYVHSHKLNVIRARPFNHLGPRQSPQFALASFARQLADILAGNSDPVIETGDLSSERDCTDVRDVVRAYVLLMEKGTVGEAYNVARRQTWSMRELLDRMIQISGAKVEMRQHEDRLRAADSSRMEVSTQKLIDTTGWSPTIDIDQTLTDILNYWRSQT